MHTKLPWSTDSIGAVNNFIDIVHHDRSKWAITRALCRVQARPTWAAEGKANADLIVRAVNNHESLVSALEVAHRYIAKLDAPFPKEWKAILPQIEEALAKAKS
jgi:hypothetical protein